MSRTVEQWFAQGDELGKKLAEVLVPKPWKHRWHRKPRGFRKCIKCDMKHRDWKDGDCTVPDPIDTEDTAFALKELRKHRKQCFGPVFTKHLIPAMIEVYRHYNRTCGHVERQELFRWFLFEAPAEALLIAAAKAVEGKEE